MTDQRSVPATGTALIVLMSLAAGAGAAPSAGRVRAHPFELDPAQGADTQQRGTTRRFFRTPTPGTLPSLLENLSPVTDDDLANPPAGEWLTHRDSYGVLGYSPLSQIDRENVGELELVWSWAMNGKRTQVQPLVHDGVMFLNQSADVIQALDAASGDLLWSYDRQLPDGLFRFAYANRNIAIYEDMIIVGTGDAHLVALDAHTGDVRWDVEVADHALGYAYSAGPIVADGRIIAPMSGCYMINEGGCWVSAHDPHDGSELWRRTTIARPDEPGGESWGDAPVEQRYGGSVWMPPSYDPETRTLYVGTAVPIPWGRAQRELAGDLLHTNSTLALDTVTGEIKWARQHLPSDNFDMDTAFERHIVVAEARPDPTEVRWIAEQLPQQPLKMLFGMFGKAGIVRAMDAESGRLLWARETYYQNIISDIDMTTGHAELNESLVGAIGEPMFVCPSLAGGRNWPGAALDIESGVFFIGFNNTCMDYTLNEVSPEPGIYHASAELGLRPVPDSDGNVSSVMAIDVSTGKQLWRRDHRGSSHSGVVATGGGLVFHGDIDRSFRALNSSSGDTLWSTRLPTPVQGTVVPYAVNGVQYLAVPTGSTSGFYGLTPEIPRPGSGSALFVFRLRDRSPD